LLTPEHRPGDHVKRPVNTSATPRGRLLTPTTTRLVLAAALLGVAALAAGLALASGGMRAPTITSAPPDSTKSTSASFSFSDTEKNVTFQCSLDSSSYSACSSPKTYSGLAEGTHTFRVLAKSAKGELSPAASYSWRIDLTPPSISFGFPLNGHSYSAAEWKSGCSQGTGVCGTASDPSGVVGVAVSIKQSSTGKYWNGKSYSNTSETYFVAKLSSQIATGASWFYALPLPAPDGGYTLHALASDRLANVTPSSSPASSTFAIQTSTVGLPFGIAGGPAGSLYPGAGAQSFPLTLTNPNANAITVTSLSVSVKSTSAAGCLTSWFALTQPAQSFSVPAKGSVTLTGSQAPTIRMIDTSTNQDACKSAKLTLAYSGSAHS
jgi:large repetitive protein